MKPEKLDTTEKQRKRKRIVPTRAAGTPAFDNPADELFAAAFANRDTKTNDEQINDTSTLPSTSIYISRPQEEDLPSTTADIKTVPSTPLTDDRPQKETLTSKESSVDVKTSTELSLPSTKGYTPSAFDGLTSLIEEINRPQKTNQPSTKGDRHSKNLARFDNRIKPSLVKAIKEFCLKFDLSQKEFVEMSAVHFIQAWTAKLDKSVDGKTALDDRVKMIMWKSTPKIINLYRAYNFENKWKFNDDEVAHKFNDTNIKIVELGIIETQFNSGFKKINSFGYYKNQIEGFAEQDLGEEMLTFLLKHYREKWQRATNRNIDFDFLDN